MVVIKSCLNLSDKNVALMAKHFGEVQVSKLVSSEFNGITPKYEDFVKNKTVIKELGIVPISKVKTELNTSYRNKISQAQIKIFNSVISRANNKMQGVNYRLHTRQQGEAANDNFFWILQKLNGNINLDAKIERAKNRITDAAQNISSITKLEDLREKRNSNNDQLSLFQKSQISTSQYETLIEQEKQNFLSEGITLSQKHNIPIINKLLYRTITPATYNLKSILTKGMYSLFVGRNYADFKNTIALLKKLNVKMPEWANNISEEQYNKRDDAWALSNGLPQKHNTFKFVGKGYIENGNIVFDVNGEDVYDFVNPVFNDVDINKVYKKGFATDKTNFVMGNYGVSTGRDATGYYIRYTDRWDLDITNQFVQKVIDITQKPFIVSGKLYKALTYTQEGEEQIYYTSVTSNSDIQNYIQVMARFNSEEAFQENRVNASPTISSKASPETIKLVKDLIKQIGVDYKTVENIVVNGKKQDANGVALTMQKIIEVVNGKESSTLPEEAMHFVVEIIKQTNPKLYKQLLKEINNYKIKNKVFAEYGSDYQKDGKPDVIKLKEEAIAKLLVEVIIKKQEGITDKPELIAKVETSWWESIKNWIRSLFIKNGFDKLALDIISGKSIGTADDIKQGSIFLQKDNKGIQQDKLINKLKETASIVIEGEKSEDGYTVNGVKTKRVSDLSKTWYDLRFADKSLLKSDYQQAVDDLVQEKGTAGHADIEYIHSLFVNKDGYLREQILDDSNYVSKINELNRDAYILLKENYKQRLTTFPKGTRFLSEQIVYNSKTNRAGKIDFLAITPEGKVSILDWKFINLNIDTYKDIPWFKVQAWNIQMREYKSILMNAYGVKNEDFEQTRMIPIKTFYTETNAKTKVLPKLIKIQIGEVNVKNIQEDYLLPVPLKEERTHKEEIDVLLAKLNSTYEKISKSPVSENQKRAKAEELNTLFTTIRQLQMKESLEPLLNQVRVLGKRVKNTIKKYENDFKGKSSEDFTSQEGNELINTFTGEIAILREALQTYEDIDVDFSYLFTKNTEEDKKLEKDLKDVVHDTKVFARQLGKLDMEFTETFIGGTSQAEKTVKGISKLFGSTSTIQIKSLQALYKKANRVFGYAGMDVQQQNKILTDLKNKYQKWANSKGFTTRNMFDILMKKDKNELIDEFNPEFFKEANKRIKDKDGSWIAQNIDIKAYALYLKEVKEKEKKHAKEKYERSLKTEKDLKILESEINNIPRLYDISDTSKPGFLLYNEIKKFPKRELWESQEWKNLNAIGNEPALAFYNYIKERNETYREIGYISHKKARVFLPWVKKSLTDKIMFGGNVTLGEQFVRNISVDSNNTTYGSYDPITGKLIDRIPKYLVNPSEGIKDNYSKDLFKTMSMYNEFAIKFKYLSSIEDQARALIRLEQNKQAIATSAFGKIERDEFGNIKLTEDNKANAKFVEDMVKAIVYQQKYIQSESTDTLLAKFGTGFEKINKILGYEVFPKDISERQLSVNKTIDTLNTTFQMTTLGLNLLSATSNFFGGKALSIINSGKYFTKQEHFATEMWLLANKMGGEDKIKNLAALDYFLPFTENYNRDGAKNLSLAKLDSQGVQDFLMILMRQTDRAVQTTNFFSFARHAIVENGKIVNVREYLRTLPKYQNMYKGATQEERNKLRAEFEKEASTIAKERNIIKIGKLENNEFVIPGIEQRSESVIELRRLVQSFTADALGNMTEENKRLINMSIYGNSFMVFKNWIPRLADVRFGNIKYNAASEAYEWGRMRLMVNIISDDISTKSMNLYNSLAGNDKGIEYLRALYERKKDSYKQETNKELEMTEDEFIELVRNNIKNQTMELVTLLSLWSLVLLLGAMTPDDDEPEEVRNSWKFVLKATDKLKDELQYFYNPASPFDILSAGVFPSMSLIKNYVTVIKNFGKEAYAIGVNDEELQDKNNVIKYFMKSFPITNQFAAYLPMFYPELAKDLGIRIQSQYGIR